MDDRDQVLSKIKTALATRMEKTPYPDWDDALPVNRKHQAFATLWELFCYRWKAVNGIALEGPKALAAFLKEKNCKVGYCDPVLADKLRPHLDAGILLETTFDRSRPDDYQFGITRAIGAIAETGTFVINDRTTSSRLGALAPWIHVAIVRPDAVWPDVPAALKNLGDDPAVIFVSGPSKTADVEGILVEGVHGPGLQACCLWAS